MDRSNLLEHSLSICLVVQ